MSPSTLFPADSGLSFQTFQRYDRILRGLLLDRQCWFVARDLARLTNSDVSGRTTRKLDPDQYRWERLAGGKDDELLVSESGLYTLLLVYFYHPENRNLRQWLSNDVVPVLHDAQSPAGSVPRHALREVQGYPLAVLEWQGGVWLRLSDAARALESERE